MREFLKKTWLMYYDGFRSMTVGRSLWLIIAIKVFIMFAILKLLFFPDKLQEEYPDDAARSEAVRSALTVGLPRQ